MWLPASGSQGEADFFSRWQISNLGLAAEYSDELFAVAVCKHLKTLPWPPRKVTKFGKAWSQSLSGRNFIRKLSSDRFQNNSIKFWSINLIQKLVQTGGAVHIIIKSVQIIFTLNISPIRFWANSLNLIRFWSNNFNQITFWSLLIRSWCRLVELHRLTSNTKSDFDHSQIEMIKINHSQTLTMRSWCRLVELHRLTSNTLSNRNDQNQSFSNTRNERLLQAGGAAQAD